MAPTTFSVSSRVLPGSEAGQRRPVTTAAIVLTRKLLPVLDSLAVTRTIGAVGIDPRRRADRSAATATEQSSAVLNGNSLNRSLSVASASSASSLVGRGEIGGSCSAPDR